MQIPAIIMDETSEYPIEYKSRFNASHFLYCDSMREELHGHNYVLTYRVKCTRSNELNSALKSALDFMSKGLNNKIIIAEECKQTVIEEGNLCTKILLPESGFYLFPNKDLYFIKSISSSAECISNYFFDKTKDLLNEDWEAVAIIVSEIYGQQEAIFFAKNISRLAE